MSTPTSLRTEAGPAHPVDLDALLHIRTLATVWSSIALDDLPDSTQRALHLVVRAGLVEGRVRLRLWMDRFPEIVRIRLGASGDWSQFDLHRRIFDSLPDGWLDRDGATVGPLRIQCHGYSQVRLTEQGELARGDMDPLLPAARGLTSAAAGTPATQARTG